MSPKFYELSPIERLNLLRDKGFLDADDVESLLRANENSALDGDVAAHMIENQISQYVLPMGVIPELIVNDKSYAVPLVVEEPSVVAAASNGAQRANHAGGVRVRVQPHRVLGEVVFVNAELEDEDLESVASTIADHRSDIFDIARHALPSMHARGGGLEDMSVECVGEFTKVLLTVNPCDAMGANAVNTIAEAVGQALEGWLHVKPLVAILSNSGRLSVVTAEVDLKPDHIAVQGMEAREVAKRIALLSDLACVDSDRAVTHNKGIMNGISSAALATGNDTRALEACAHEYACQDGQYMPLSRWSWSEDAQLLHGRIEIPLQVGLVGGAVSSLPIARIARAMGSYENVDEFAGVLAAVGLVQNLSALRALVGSGIQAGHMALHMNSLAISAEALGDEISLVAHSLRQLPASERTADKARQIVQDLRSERI